MRSIRLLPVVILAAAALLLLKGVGIVTHGGYVLTGTVSVEAAGGGGHGSDSSGEQVLSTPLERTIADTSPTLKDDAPTLPLHGKEPVHGNEAASHATDAAGHVASGLAGDAAPCPPDGGAIAVHGTETSPEDCAEAASNAAGDVLPTTLDGDGKKVPMAAEGSGSAEAVNERLGARREALEQREAELDMRLALVEAAEKRLEERTVALRALEARINTLVEAKKANDDAQFKALVAMYEAMKPKEAALILDQLETSVVLRVAKAIPPRKMAQIMAKMSPERAKLLTAGMASEQVDPVVGSADENLAALPQIVGQ